MADIKPKNARGAVVLEQVKRREPVIFQQLNWDHAEGLPAYSVGDQYTTKTAPKICLDWTLPADIAASVGAEAALAPRKKTRRGLDYGALDPGRLVDALLGAEDVFYEKQFAPSLGSVLIVIDTNNSHSDDDKILTLKLRAALKAAAECEQNALDCAIYGYQQGADDLDTHRQYQIAFKVKDFGEPILPSLTALLMDGEMKRLYRCSTMQSTGGGYTGQNGYDDQKLSSAFVRGFSPAKLIWISSRNTASRGACPSALLPDIDCQEIFA